MDKVKCCVYTKDSKASAAAGHGTPTNCWTSEREWWRQWLDGGVKDPMPPATYRKVPGWHMWHFIPKKGPRQPITCPICLGYIGIGEVMAVTPCQHFFHSRCIIRWVLQNNNCPVCRKKLNFYVKELPYLFENK